MITICLILVGIIALVLLAVQFGHKVADFLGIQRISDEQAEINSKLIEQADHLKLQPNQIAVAYVPEPEPEINVRVISSRDWKREEQKVEVKKWEESDITTKDHLLGEPKHIKQRRHAIGMIGSGVTGATVGVTDVFAKSTPTPTADVSNVINMLDTLVDDSPSHHHNDSSHHSFDDCGSSHSDSSHGCDTSFGD